MFTLCVAQAGAELDTLTVSAFNVQSASHAFVFTFAGDVADDDSFGVLQGLELEQHVATARCDQTARQMQHQPFPTALHHIVQLGLQCRAVGYVELLDDL